ncbi:3-hydroxybutyrate dehydrogenase [Hyphomonas neptunium ATCC 15444]|uniref:3-hydroxybutyrate dehydrogenase n=2 Tax=Hyphomonas TaxID=85 RepID=Q0C5Y4_HYPNA|nr:MULTISPECIES: 3-hydroxybutyrate dehydrogenase [Hyphomonas]ABI76124.1 3-hydroxybutyrate dehydrogenase [Hyphomonas neptunium ATCC 15444]KCZ89391.1 3-hydroxybutyrate dehydrogenase [Hyphomonas hirschiana VP5]
MLAGKTALITGSTSGIGKAVALQLAADGANIVLNGFGDAKEIETLRAGIEKDHKVKAAFSGADLTKPEAIEAMMTEAAGTFGGIDILVNNAGTQFVSPLEDFPVEKWNLIIALNLSAAFHTTRLALPHMKAKKWGRIVNMGSAHAKVASPFKAAYVAAKHGLSGLTKTTALEGATHGVRCNTICPGYVFTPLVEGQIADTAKARGMTEDQVKNDVLLAAQPTKEFVTAEEVAAFASFLCSPAAAQINGADLSIDGGWTAQ